MEYTTVHDWGSDLGSANEEAEQGSKIAELHNFTILQFYNPAMTYILRKMNHVDSPTHTVIQSSTYSRLCEDFARKGDWACCEFLVKNKNAAAAAVATTTTSLEWLGIKLKSYTSHPSSVPMMSS